MDTDLSLKFPAAVRRILLILMSLVVSAVMGSALVASWNEPQVASRLELYQTDLLLQATAWQGENLSAAQATFLRENLLGQTPLKDAQTAYETVRRTATTTLKNNAETGTARAPRLQSALEDQAELLDLLDLRLGILLAEQQDLVGAQEAWSAVKQRQSTGSPLWRTADALHELWLGQSVPVNSEQIFSTVLQGWFRDRALEQTYHETQATAALNQLQQQETAKAEQTILTLAAVGALPVVGTLIGTTILAFVLVQRLLKGREAWLALNGDRRWNPPWTAETIWIVLVGGFLFMGQLVIPVVVSPLRGTLVALGIRGQALYALTYYCLMAIGAIAVLFFALRPYRPLSEKDQWFQVNFTDNWLLWGIGGYLAALPLMLTVSILNQQLWQGQGGSNPLLQTVLEAQDPIALILFFVTAAIAAPLFEEFLFRGFLLPSLTRYMPVGSATILSSLVFAIAHLSLSEVPPLAVLGMVLGVVYTRSRNLLAPMLLHSAWNSVTMLGLFLLGRSVN